MAISGVLLGGDLGVWALDMDGQPGLGVRAELG